MADEPDDDRFAGLDVMPPDLGDSGVSASNAIPDDTDPDAGVAPYAARTAVRPAVRADAPSPVEDTPARGLPHTDAPYQPQPARRPRQAPARRPRPRRGPRHPFLSFVLWVLMLPVLALIAARMVPAEYASGRAIPELVSFVPLTLVVTIPSFVLALLWRRHLLAPVAGVAMALVAWWHVGYFVPSGQLSESARAAAATGVSTGDGVVRIMTLNTDNGSASAADVVAAVRAGNVEVLALQEVTQSFMAQLSSAGIDELLPYSVSSVSTVNDNGGVNCLYTAAPMSDTSSDLVPTIMSKMCAGSIDAAGVTLRFVSAHPNSPHKGGEDLWGAGLTSIADLSGYDHVYVICGDFNSTWDHARFRELLGTSFVDADEQAGEGFHMTYPSSSRVPALIEIDHVVYSASSGVFVGDLATQRISGTDHLALFATLEVQS